MLNSKLIDLLKKFNTKQRTRFAEFVSSPYFNKNRELVRFYAYILKFSPRFINKKLNREIAFKSLYPTTKYNEKKLGYLMTDLVKLAENFIAVEHYVKDDIKPSFDLLESYEHWSMDKYFAATMRDARSNLSSQTYRDSTYYYNLFRLDEMDSLFFDKQRKRLFDENLQNASDNLDRHYLAVKLKYSCEIANRQNVIASDYELRFLDEILAYLADHPQDDIPAISIYYQILMTILEYENEEHFKKLKNLLETHVSSFTVSEARDMFAYTQNYCIKKINTGNLAYLHELFDLYKKILSLKIIYVDDILPHWTYKNIVTVALRLQENEWAEDFIEKNKSFLSERHAETAYSFNKANLCYHNKQYGEALDLLQRVSYTDYYQLNVKLLLLKIYYELDEIDALLSLMDAFKVFLRRNKRISTYQKTSYTNLLKYAKKLIRIPPGDKKKALEMKEAIKDEKEVPEIDWLLEKLDGLS